MFKNKVGLTVLVLFGIMLASSGMVIGGNDVKVLDLTQAVNLALENNIELQIAEINFKNAEINYKKGQANNISNQSQYNKLQNQYSFIQAQNTYHQQKQQIITKIVSQYIQILQSRLNVKIKEKGLDLQKKKLEEIRSQVKAGHKSQLDLIQQKNSYQETLFTLTKAENGLKQQLRQFKTDLGFNQDKKLNLKQINYSKKVELDEKEVVEKGIENNTALKLRKKDIELAELELKKAKTASTPKLDLNRLKNKLKLAQLEYNNNKKNLTNSLYKQYQQYQQAGTNLNLSCNDLKEAKKNYQIVKKQQQAGLKTANQLITAHKNLQQSEYNKMTAFKNYLIKVLELKNVIGADLRGFISEFNKEK